MNLAEAAARVFTPDLRWVLPCLVALAAALSAAAKQSRQRLAAATAPLGLGLAALFLAAGGLALGLPPESKLTVLFIAVAHMSLWVCGIGLLGVLIFDALLPRLSVRLPALARDIVLAVAYAAAALTVASEAGANVTGLLATSAVVTAVVGLAMQDTLSNLMGGMVLQLDQPFSVGDWVRIGSDEGQVREIRWRQTTLITYVGNTLILPNSQVTKSVVTVFGLRAGAERVRFREVLFPVYYDRSPDEVIGAVENALRSDPPPAVAAAPAAVCVVADYQPGHVVYAARYFLRDLSSPGAADSEVRARVYYALARRGIKLSVPQRSLVVHQSDEDVKETSRRREAGRRLAALRGVDILAALTDEERAVLAQRLAATPFFRGELITRQGAKADWLYIIVEGEAEVRVSGEGGALGRVIARLSAGEFVGEMGLLTDEPRSATVVALGEVLCYRLDREAFKDVLASRPEIADGISRTLARRKAELEAAKGELSESLVRQREEAVSGDLLSRIRGIFGL